MENLTVKGLGSNPSPGVGNGSRLGLVKHTGATGGMIVTGDTEGHRLTPIQFDLLELLWLRHSEDADKHEAVRGYVSSPELLCSLPWDTVHPDLAHLKQLIRRVRRRILPLGLGVQACYGLGYRLVLSGSSRQVD
jgi:hypothetical protein